jgi:hypothetical protein
MTVTAASFRTAFPAFANTATYPDAQIDFWIALALLMHNAERWGNLLDYGVMYFVAHNLTLEFNANRAATLGQNPGPVLGAVTSGSVDGSSYSRDPGQAMDPNNGHWNLSVYGLRWKEMQRLVGAGPVQVGVGCTTPSISAAWPGVIY